MHDKVIVNVRFLNKWRIAETKKMIIIKIDNFVNDKLDKMQQYDRFCFNK